MDKVKRRRNHYIHRKHEACSPGIYEKVDWTGKRNGKWIGRSLN